MGRERERYARGLVEKEKPGWDSARMCPALASGALLQDVKCIEELNTHCGIIYWLFDVKEVSGNEFPCVVSVVDVARRM